MPSLPLHPRPDRRPLDPGAAPPAEGHAETTGPAVEASPATLPDPDGAPVDPESERARWRDRRTGLIALVVVTIALWAVLAAAVGFATTM